MVKECIQVLNKLADRDHVELVCIPAHSAVEANEKANQLASSYLGSDQNICERTEKIIGFEITTI